MSRTIVQTGARAAAAPAPDRLRPGRTHHAYRALVELAAAMRGAADELAHEAEVLDYGCGGMPYRPLFMARGVRYTGADFNGTPGVELTLTDDGSVPAAESSFDAVLSSQVLEHVPSPAAYLAEARRVLRPDGILLLSTHGIWPYHPHPVDYWRWTADGLRRTVEQAGFVVGRFHGILGAAAAGIQLWQDTVLRSTPRGLQPPLILSCQTLIGLHERFASERSRARDAAIYFLTARPADAGPAA